MSEEHNLDNLTPEQVSETPSLQFTHDTSERYCMWKTSNDEIAFSMGGIDVLVFPPGPISLDGVQGLPFKWEELTAAREATAKAEAERDLLKGPIPDREVLGKIVRMVWISWAKKRPMPIKPSWLIEWDELNEPDKEADRQIGEALAGYTDGWQRRLAQDAEQKLDAQKVMLDAINSELEVQSSENRKLRAELATVSAERDELKRWKEKADRDAQTLFAYRDALRAENEQLKKVLARANPPPELAYKCLNLLDAAGCGKEGAPHGNTLTGMVLEITEANAQLKGRLELANTLVPELQETARKINADFGVASKERDTAVAALRASEAGAAVMRRALVAADHFTHVDVSRGPAANDWIEMRLLVGKALSSTAGASLLAERDRLRTALGDVRPAIDRLAWAIQFFAHRDLLDTLPHRDGIPWHNAEEWLKEAPAHYEMARAALSPSTEGQQP